MESPTQDKQILLTTFREMILKNVREFRKTHGQPCALITLETIILQDRQLESLEGGGK